MPNDKFSLGPVERGADVPNRNGVLWVDTSTTPDTVKIQVNESNAAVPEYVTFETGATAGGGTNPLLDGSTHTDTTNSTPVRGDLVVANSTPAWTRKAKGTINQVLTMVDGNDPGWADSQTSFNMGYFHRRIPVVYATWYTTIANGILSTEYANNSLANTPAIIGGSTGTVDRKNGGLFWTLPGGTLGPLNTFTHAFSPDNYPYMRLRISLTDNNDGCMWFGFNLGGTFSNLADNASEYVAFRLRNGTDTNWQCVSDDNVAQQITDSTVALDGDLHTFEIWTPDGGTSWKFAIDGTVRATHSTRVPAVTGSLLFRIHNAQITSTVREGWIKSLLLCVTDPDSTDNRSNSDDIDSGGAGI
jgi:hypothetical protein